MESKKAINSDIKILSDMVEKHFGTLGKIEKDMDPDNVPKEEYTEIRYALEQLSHVEGFLPDSLVSAVEAINKQRKWR